MKSLSKLLLKFIELIMRFRGLTSTKHNNLNHPPVFTVADTRTIKNKTHEQLETTQTNEGTTIKSIKFKVETDFAFGYGDIHIIATGIYSLDQEQTIDSIKWETNKIENATQHYPVIHLTDGTQIGHNGKVQPENG